MYGHPRTNHVELTLVTPPVNEPVDLHLVKAQTRIPYADADELLSFYITAARDRIEQYLRRSLITQTWDLTLDWGPAWVELPRPPLQSVIGVYTTDYANNEAAVPTNVYFVDTRTARVALNVGGVWPIHRGIAGFRVRYVAGYGDTRASVPAAISKEILSLVAQYDDIRETIDLPNQTQALLRPYRVEGEGIRMSKGWTRGDMLA